MLNVDTIKNGLVIDHIKAGYGPKIFSWLGLDKADYCVALIMNVSSKTQGRKDIIKIDNIINIDYSVLGFIDPNITVNVVSDEKIENIIKCKNPRCITTTENYVAQKFKLVNKEKAEYACEYCDQIHSAGTDF